jgi:hypothetical protein
VCRILLFVSVQEYFIAYCRRREAVKLLFPAVTLQPDRNLQQFAELQVSLTGRDEVRDIYVLF